MTVGHLRMITDASAFGKVIVLLNSDEWLTRKKNYVFMPFAERKEILEGTRNIHVVLPALDGDETVCASLSSLRDVIKYFGNGGDRYACNTPELELCEKLEIIPLFGLGGNKVQSSSQLVKNVQKGQ